MTLFAVRYTYDDRADVRDTVRPEHRAWLAGLAEAGSLLGSGPFADDDAPGALLVFRADDEAALRDLLTHDPFARERLVAQTEVRTWQLVLGPWAADA